jgi:hypothetical protein
MITFDTAREIFIQIENSKLDKLRVSLYKSAFHYVEYRFNWNFQTHEDRLEMIDKERSIAHNAFISNCDIMARNMGKIGEPSQWRTHLTNDRKIIGDFACMLVALIGIKNR